jgi:8-oxo-dGTP pyrophosphatase MutT (NUDIX family)
MAPDANGRFLVVVAFVIERDNHVLLLRRSLSKDHAAGEWEPGSGRVRQGEAALAAVLREAKEETGLDVTVLGLLDTFHFYRGTAREETIGIVFHCRATGKDLTLSPEHVEAKWVPFEQLQDLACSEWIRRSFAALLARRHSAPLCSS